MKYWENKFAWVQDKGSRFVFLNTNSYVENKEPQINGSSLDKLNSVPSSKFKQTVIDWIEKWSDKVNKYRKNLWNLATARLVNSTE